MKTKTTHLAGALLLSQATLLPAGTLIFGDNFNAPDSTNLDTSTQTGRRSGLLGESVQVRSSRIQHGIAGNQLDLKRHLTSGSGRIRFHQTASLPTNVWTDFASGTAGTTLLAEGGVRIEFDWTPPNNTSNDWISFSAGIDGIGTAEPATRVNAAGTDFGILFRGNGGTQYFDNAVATTGSTFDVLSAPTHRVSIQLAFTSFNDTNSFTASANVDGTEVLAAGIPFTWDNNLGVLNLEIGNYLATSSKIDNLTISGLQGFEVKLAKNSFYSSVTQGGLISLLTGQNSGATEATTFSLVTGTGDTDNAKFKITGNRLEANNFNFLPVADGTAYSVRLRGVGNVSSNSSTQAYTLTVIADSDSDDLPDTWERTITGGSVNSGNLTDLNGRGTQPGPGAGTGDFDADGLTDLAEYNLTQSIYPMLSPILADTDGDGLKDGEELNPTGFRLATNPTVADTDKDGLNDFVETNAGFFTSPTDPGTSPLAYDSDNDLFPDGYEVTRGSSPLNPAEIPTLPAPLTTVAITTEASTGISPAKTYTHLISGGFPATINGVTLQTVSATVPANGLTWTANRTEFTTATFNQVGPNNLGATWMPLFGGIEEQGLLDLFGGFIYSGNGDVPGSYQTYFLSGLTPGLKYELRFYIRSWSSTGSGRPSSLTFINGAQSVNAYVLEDRPGIMQANNNIDSAYCLSFPYTAAGSDITVRAAVPQTTLPISGSWHLYGLTNEVVSTVPATPFGVSSVTYQKNPVPAVTLTFTSEIGATYAVDSSTTLTASGQPGGWSQIATNLPSGGTQTTFTDTASVGTGPRVFYRVRRLP